MSKPDLTVTGLGPVPDVFFDRKVRDRIYLVSWLGGGVLSIVAAVILAAAAVVPGYQVPVVFVLILAAWNAWQSWFVAPIAKANTFPSRPAAVDASS